jgi:hypothetical protein
VSRKSRSQSADGPLVCPSCARTYPLSERFCRADGMPLVYGGAAARSGPPTPAQERARKIDPQYSQGEPVRVAFARNQAESDLVQNILLEEGIPSMARRSRGFDVPDFLAAGPRDILVPFSGAQAARELLNEAEVAETVEPTAERPLQAAGFRIAAAVLGGGLLAALVAWLLVRGAG